MRIRRQQRRRSRTVHFTGQRIIKGYICDLDLQANISVGFLPTMQRLYVFQLENVMTGSGSTDFGVSRYVHECFHMSVVISIFFYGVLTKNNIKNTFTKSIIR